MDRNLNISTTPIETCTQTAPHTHSTEELHQLRIAILRTGRRGRQVFTCPMIRAWRRQFDDTYEVHTAPTLAGEPRSDEQTVHDSRALEADIQVSNILLRWHCDGWPVGTPRTAGETDLDGDAPQPAPVPELNDPNCFGYAHRVPAATLPPTRARNIEDEDQYRSKRGGTDQPDMERWVRAGFAPTFLERLRSARRDVTFDATFVRATAIPNDSGESNYNPGWYDKQPSTAFRHAPWVIELTTMNRDASEPEPSLLDPELLD